MACFLHKGTGRFAWLLEVFGCVGSQKHKLNKKNTQKSSEHQKPGPRRSWRCSLDRCPNPGSPQEHLPLPEGQFLQKKIPWDSFFGFLLMVFLWFLVFVFLFFFLVFGFLELLTCLFVDSF